jgi:hypothetical protein
MGVYRRPGPRGILFVSIASAAENFLSTCGLERGAPQCSAQPLPAATPHVGQATEDNCLGVSSFLFIETECPPVTSAPNSSTCESLSKHILPGNSRKRKCTLHTGSAKRVQVASNVTCPGVEVVGDVTELDRALLVPAYLPQQWSVPMVRRYWNS